MYTNEREIFTTKIQPNENPSNAHNKNYNDDIKIR